MHVRVNRQYNPIMPEVSGDSLVNVPVIISHLLLQPGMRAADFGCGFSGYIAFPMAEKVGEEGMVYAIDVQPKVLENIKSLAEANHIEHLKTIWANLEIRGSSKLPADSLDVVAMVNILFQTKQPADLFQEALRVLKIHGRLMVVDWKKQINNVGPSIDQCIDMQKVKQFAQQYNMKEVEHFEAGPYHYGIVFEKFF